MQTISEPANGTKPIELSPATGADPMVSGGKIEITLPNGTSVKVGHGVGLVTLRRVMSVLRRWLSHHRVFASGWQQVRLTCVAG
jgi:hypothetical protein